MWSTTLLLAALASLRVGVDAGPETPALVELLRLELPGVDTGTTSGDRELWVSLRGDALVIERSGGGMTRRALDQLLDPAARRRVVALIVTEAAAELGYVRAVPTRSAGPAPDAPVREAAPAPGPTSAPGSTSAPAAPLDATAPGAPRDLALSPGLSSAPAAPEVSAALEESSALDEAGPWALGVHAGVEVATGVGAPRPLLRARLARTDLVVEPYVVLMVGGFACCLLTQPGIEARTATSLAGVGVELGLLDVGPVELRWATEVVVGASWMSARALSYADRAPSEFSVDLALGLLAGPVLRWPLGPRLALDLSGGLMLWARRAAVAVPAGYVGADAPLDPGVAWPHLQVGLRMGL